MRPIKFMAMKICYFFERLFIEEIYFTEKRIISTDTWLQCNEMLKGTFCYSSVERYLCVLNVRRAILNAFFKRKNELK